MQSIEIHTQAENGRVSFDLPAEYAVLANARLVVTLVPEGEAAPAKDSMPPQFPHTDWEALRRAYDSFEGHDPYPTITDAVAWQREIRSEWDRDLTPPQP